MSGRNAEQIAYWNEQAGPHWAAAQERLDVMLEPLGLEAVDVAAPQAGEAVLDVGCGCGQTTLELAARVSPRGRATGLDPSEPMLARARERAAGLGQVRFEVGDAQTHDFGTERFDAVFSRFGVMFFSDPVAAFANLRGALAPGGRLAFVCWQEPARNPWASAPARALLDLVPAPPPAEPGAPGPFAFADRDRLVRILRDAGLADVRVEPSEGTLSLGGSRTLDEATAFAIGVGPASRLLVGQPPEVVEAARKAVREVLAPFADASGVRVPRATWIASARAG